MKIAVIPIDNRPVCYNLVKDIAAVDSSIELFLPPREMLGDLNKIADIDGIYNWLKDLPKVDAFVIALDTVAHGGLIPSRRSSDTFDEIKSRIEKFKKLLEDKEAKIYAFSSIMRISNNNINEEEKEYWNKYGKKIFDYSFNSHKNNAESCIQSLIPSEIIDDYMQTRKRNFEINKLYLEWNLFDTLVFSKDDCAEYGFNVQEAQALTQAGGFVKTGADEIPLTLFARAIGGDLGINPVFLAPEHNGLISKYEDVSIEKSVLGQIELSGSKVGNDVTLVINNFEDHQGEIVMKVDTKPFSGEFEAPKAPYMVADVRYANGADNSFVELFDFVPNLGYSAWNTSANTLGSLICAAKVKFFAKEYNEEAFKKLQTIRLLDDWAYQANIRQTLSAPCDISAPMKPFEEKVAQLVGKSYRVEYSFPWNRLFEVEVNVLD